MLYSGAMADIATPHNESSPSPRWGRWAVPVIAALILGVGVVLMLLPEEQKTVGWFAYQPLADEIMIPDAALLSGRPALGLVFAAVGALTLAFLAGWRLRGATSKSQPQRP